MYFSVWLLLLSIVWRFVCIVVYSCMLLNPIATLHSIVQLYHTLLIYSAFDAH